MRGTLGAGGAGTVYRAFDRQLQREIALKLLRQASGRDLYRFKREFRALADIVHPNLVALHELHAADGDWYFTMELVEGVSFIDWVRPARAAGGVHGGATRTRQDILATPVHEMRLRGVLVQLVDALIALHKAGKLHRDLKPSNVLVTAQGRLALLDFGLVANFAEDNPERLAVGTPVYMSPEQASDQPLTEASDWYSVGAMLYEALTGRRPFEGDSEQVMTRKQTEVPASPIQVVPNAPRELSELAMRLLQAAPSTRPSGFAILDQLGASPSPRTRDIVRTAVPASFVGRTRELEELRRALGDSRGRGVAVMVRGKSGIGKSTLVRKFLRSVSDSVFVLEGRCFEREQVPFKMLDGMVDTLTAVLLVLPSAEIETVMPRDLGALVRLFPVMKRVRRLAEVATTGAAPADPAELRRRGFQALRHVLARLSRIRPVVIFVDDAHWGDADSASFLAELIQHGEPSTLVLLAHRPEDYLGIVKKLKTAPNSVARHGDVRELDVPALSDVEAGTLVAQLSNNAGRTDAVVRTSGGNPLILSEIARAPHLPVGARIEDLVRHRAARLSLEAQAMLAVSSIAARPLPVEIAAHAAGVVSGHAAATELMGERLASVRRVNDQTILSPAHDFVRVAVLANLDIESKAGWHEALARAFEEVQGEANLDSQAVVEHWLAAGHPAHAAHHAVPAALRAEEALAFRRAAELYEIALAYGPWDAAGQRDLLRRKAHALTCGGQLDEAATVYGHAAQLLQDDEAVDLERLRIEALLRRGRLDEALPAAEKLLAQIGIRVGFGKASRTKLSSYLSSHLSTPWLQKLRGLDYVERDPSEVKPADLLRIDVLYSVVSGLAFINPSLGRMLQPELLRAAFDCGEPLRVCLALAQELCYAASAGSRSWPATAAVGTRLKSIVVRLDHPNISGLADVTIGIAAYMGGRWRDARNHLETGLVTLRDHGAGVRWEIDVAETYWLSTLYYLGEWRELIRQSQVLLRDAIERGDVIAQQGIRTGRPSLAWLLAGKPQEARAQLDAAEQTLAPGFHLPHVLAIQAACNIALYAGDASAAAQRLEDAWPNIERLGVFGLQHLRVELLLLRARLAIADTARPLDDRLRQARAASDELLKEGAPWAAGLGHLVRAAVLVARGNDDQAVLALLAAEDQLVGSEMVGWLHVARIRRGFLEGGPGGAARAEAARDVLKDLGAADPDAVAALLVPWPR